MVKRFAFTMIELIFAIVLIGISVLSLPMMTQVMSKNTEGSIVQEAIFAASAELNQLVSYQWDEASREATSSLSRVVWTSSADCDVNNRRPGHIDQPYHRRCRDENATRPSLTIDATTPDLDDFANGTPQSIFVGYAATSTGYKQDYNKTVVVNFADFENGVANGNNIKLIQVSISNEDGKPITTLSTFSSNIGEIDYFKRLY